MTQVNICLKRVFTIFNIIFAIIGALIIGLAVLCHLTVAHHEEFEFHHELLMLYIVGLLTLVLGVLGAYGAHKERLVPLIIFLVCMVTGSLLMLDAAISNTPDRSQLKTLLERRFQSSLPLASSKEQNEIKLVQSEYQCCGVFSYTDWSDDIPDSCLCSAEEQQEQGLCKTVTYKRFLRKSIYAEPCFPIILHYTYLLFDVALGVVFALLVLALLGTILSSIIIHQMRYPTPRPETAESPPPAYTSVAPVFFTTALPKYQELHNPPSC